MRQHQQGKGVFWGNLEQAIGRPPCTAMVPLPQADQRLHAPRCHRIGPLLHCQAQRLLSLGDPVLKEVDHPEVIPALIVRGVATEGSLQAGLRGCQVPFTQGQQPVQVLDRQGDTGALADSLNGGSSTLKVPRLDLQHGQLKPVRHAQPVKRHGLGVVGGCVLELAERAGQIPSGTPGVGVAGIKLDSGFKVGFGGRDIPFHHG